MSRLRDELEQMQASAAVPGPRRDLQTMLVCVVVLGGLGWWQPWRVPEEPLIAGLQGPLARYRHAADQPDPRSPCRSERCTVTTEPLSSLDHAGQLVETRMPTGALDAAASGRRMWVMIEQRAVPLQIDDLGSIGGRRRPPSPHSARARAASRAGPDGLPIAAADWAQFDPWLRAVLVRAVADDALLDGMAVVVESGQTLQPGERIRSRDERK